MAKDTRRGRSRKDAAGRRACCRTVRVGCCDDKIALEVCARGSPESVTAGVCRAEMRGRLDGLAEDLPRAERRVAGYFLWELAMVSSAALAHRAVLPGGARPRLEPHAAGSVCDL